MNLRKLKDQELLSVLKSLVANERELLTQILHHLKEVEYRKLFSDLGYSSLFDYAVKELKYSEGQAHRRIQAMRLLKELPEIEEKIQSGELSLSNIIQAQSYFRPASKSGHLPFSATDDSFGWAIDSKEKRVEENLAALQPCSSAKSSKLKILKQLGNKSAREGEKFLLSLDAAVALPKERERVLTKTDSEIRFVINNELKANLEKVRSLLGTKALKMSFADLSLK